MPIYSASFQLQEEDMDTLTHTLHSHICPGLAESSDHAQDASPQREGDGPEQDLPRTVANHANDDDDDDNGAALNGALVRVDWPMQGNDGPGGSFRPSSEVSRMLQVAVGIPPLCGDPRTRLLFYLNRIREAVELGPVVEALHLKHLKFARLDSLSCAEMTTQEVEELVKLCKAVAPSVLLGSVLFLLGESALGDRLVYAEFDKRDYSRDVCLSRGVRLPIWRLMAASPEWFQTHCQSLVADYDDWIQNPWTLVRPSPGGPFAGPRRRRRQEVIARARSVAWILTLIFAAIISIIVFTMQG